VLRRVRLRAPSARPERPRRPLVMVVPARGARAVVEERLTVPAAPAAAQWSAPIA
jgi:hypothetical protein